MDTVETGQEANLETEVVDDPAFLPTVRSLAALERERLHSPSRDACAL